VGVYQRHTYSEEKREALNKWAADVEKIVDARPPTSAVGLDLTAPAMKRVSVRERKRLYRAASLARSASHTAR
jgi:hypothetical protein